MSKERIQIDLEYDASSHDPVALRRFLKMVLRNYGLKCVDVVRRVQPVSGVVENKIVAPKKNFTNGS
jgi:hypothetical protein